MPATKKSSILIQKYGGVTMKYAIEVNNLNKTYDGFTLKDASFKLETGTIMGIVGENGAGKSTIIKGILNLINIDSGEIKIFGKDFKENEMEIKKDIAVVFDESYFHDNLKIKDIDKIMKNIYPSWNKNEFQKYINKFKLSNDKRVKDFSRGMKMKLSIAVALSHGAKLLILDEATSGLDPVVRDEILDIFLNYIQNEDCSILIASHITSDLEKIADYITFVNDGQIIFSENKDELIYNSGVVKCSENEIDRIKKEDIVGIRKNTFGCEVMVNNRIYYEDMGFVVDKTNLEEIILFKVRGAR